MTNDDHGRDGAGSFQCTYASGASGVNLISLTETTFWLSQLRYNPYESPGAIDESGNQSRDGSRNWRWMTYAVACMLIACIPIYGYYTHALWSSQQTVLWLMLAWLITLINAIVCFFCGVVRTRKGASSATYWFVLSAVLSLMLFFGFCGIGNAVSELWVG